MRIAMLTELYPPSIGGQELFFAGISEALLEQGHTVDIYCIGHEAGLLPREERRGLTILRAPMNETYKQPRAKWARRNWGAILKYAYIVRKAALAQNYDLYFLNQWPLLHVVALPREARRRAVLHWCEIRTGRFYRLVQMCLPRLVRLNAAISNSVAEEIERTSGQNVFCLPSGLKLAEYRSHPRASRKNILSLGRITEHKNIIMLVESFEQLKIGGYEGRLIIAGDGPGMADLRARVSKSFVAKDIDLLGSISDGDKTALLAQSEVFAMPSRREGFPRVVAEAMASGLPTVTADFPENGTKEVVRRSGAGVVTAPDAHAFSGGVASVLANWEQLSQAGLRQARELDWSQIVRKLESSAIELRN